MALALRRRGGAAPAALTVVANGVLVAVLLLAGAGAALAVALLVPLAISMWARPQRAMLALAALVPFDGILLIVPHPRWVNGWKVGLVVAILAATFVAPAEARAPFGRKLPGWLPALAALAVVGAVSAVLVGGMQGFVGLKLVFFYVLLAVAAWRCPLDERERDRLVTVLMVTGVVTAVIGLAQQVAGAERLGELGWEFGESIRTTGGYLRSFSTFSQPFPFGFFLMLVLLVGLALALPDRQRPRNRAFLLAAPLLVAALGFTFVRGAWVGLAVGLLYLGLTRHRSLLLVFPLAAVALLYLPTDVASSARASASGEHRVTAWQVNAGEIVANPGGVGIGASGAAIEKVSVYRGDGPEYFQADNYYYFKVAFELGVVGLWLFVLLLVAVFRTTTVAAGRLAGPDGELARGVAAMVLAAGVASVVQAYFEIFPMDLFFWFLLAVVASCAAESD